MQGEVISASGVEWGRGAVWPLRSVDDKPQLEHKKKRTVNQSIQMRERERSFPDRASEGRRGSTGSIN